MSRSWIDSRCRADVPPLYSNQLPSSLDAYYGLAGDSLRTTLFELDGRRGLLVLGIMFVDLVGSDDPMWQYGLHQ